MFVLIQFLLRASFGMAAAMAGTPSKQVTSGYYRNHLYVILGLNVLATLVAISHGGDFPYWPPLTAAVLSYVGSVAWLYEKKTVGVVFLTAIAAVCLIGAWIIPQGVTVAPADCLSESGFPYPGQAFLRFFDPLSGGLLLGETLAAMFLGHWYLNTPTMKLAPLKQLVLAMGAAVLLRAAVCGTGLALTLEYCPPHTLSIWFVLLRWLAGLIGTLGVVWMTWETLKIPNTQSATGILYVGVILTFIGELASLLMSQGGAYPV